MKKLFSLFIILATLSCSTTDDLVNPTTQSPVDVYVSGIKNSYATYWKNNQEFQLSGGLDIRADTISVSNNNIHVLGVKYLNQNDKEFFYWKNNEITNLTEAFSTPEQIVKRITGMEIVGEDVYFVGYTKMPLITAEIYSLVYWKNGVKTVLSTTNKYDNSRIKVLNNDVYITGSNTSNSTGVYVNNIFQSVPDNVNLNGISFKNNEVYVYGSIYNQIEFKGYYKNISTGSEVILPALSRINRLVFEMDDNYSSSTTDILKNETSIYSGTPSIQDSFVLNQNVYVLNNIYGFNNNECKLIINNTSVFNFIFSSNLSFSENSFRGLFVVQN